MATRFRRFGVTAIGACAGVGLATWTLNPFDKSLTVNQHAFKQSMHADTQFTPFFYLYFLKCLIRVASERSINSNTPCQTKASSP